MSIVLRILLLVGAFFMTWHTVMTIKKSKVQMKDTIGWLLVSFVLMIFAFVPEIPIGLSNIIGIESAANMVFLMFLAILLYMVFHLAIKVSMLEDKIVTLSGEVAIRDNLNAEVCENKDL